MGWLGQNLQKVGAWISGRLLPPYSVVIVEESLPQRLERRTLYVVREDGFNEQVAMICPCGCKQVLHMNLLPDERPCWAIEKHRDGSYSLSPSVWRKVGCGSHFWFRRSRVHWCKDSGPWWAKL